MHDGVAELFGTGRNFPTLATILDDGAPHAVSIWSGVQGDNIIFFTSPGARKARNIARDPRVALSVVDLQNPYRTAWVRGTVVETITGEKALEVVDRVSERYTGGPFDMRDVQLYVVEVTHDGFLEIPLEH